MRTVIYASAGEDLPLLLKGNAGPLEQDDHAFHGMYHSAVRGLLVAALLVSTVASRANASNQEDDVPPLKKGNAAVLEVDDHAFASGYDASLMSARAEQIVLQRVAVRVDRDFIGDDVPTLVASSVGNGSVLGEGDAGFVAYFPLPFSPSLRVPFIATVVEDDLPSLPPPLPVSSDSATAGAVVTAPPRYIVITAGGEEFPALGGTQPAAVEDDTPQQIVPRTSLLPQLTTVDEEFPVLVGGVLEDDTVATQPAPRALAIPIAPAVGEDDFQVPTAFEDEGSPAVRTPAFVFVQASYDVDFPIAAVVQTPFEDHVTTWVPRLLAAPQIPIVDEEFPALSAGAPTLQLPEDELPRLIQTPQPRIIFPTAIDDDIPTLVAAAPSLVTEDHVTPFVPRLAPVFLTQIGDDDYCSPSVYEDEGAPGIQAAHSPIVLPRSPVEDFPVLVTPAIAFDEETQIPRVQTIPPPFRGTIGEGDVALSSWKPPSITVLTDITVIQVTQRLTAITAGVRLSVISAPVKLTPPIVPTTLTRGT